MSSSNISGSQKGPYSLQPHSAAQAQAAASSSQNNVYPTRSAIATGTANLFTPPPQAPKLAKKVNFAKNLSYDSSSEESLASVYSSSSDYSSSDEADVKANVASASASASASAASFSSKTASQVERVAIVFFGPVFDGRPAHSRAAVYFKNDTAEIRDYSCGGDLLLKNLQYGDIYDVYKQNGKLFSEKRPNKKYGIFEFN